jgi:hypothetical protein
MLDFLRDFIGRRRAWPMNERNQDEADDHQQQP